MLDNRVSVTSVFFLFFLKNELASRERERERFFVSNKNISMEGGENIILLIVIEIN